MPDFIYSGIQEDSDKIKDQREFILNIIKLFEEDRMPKMIFNYKLFLGLMFDRAKRINGKWQSNDSYPLLIGIINTQFADLYDFKYLFGMSVEEINILLKSTFDFRSQGKKSLASALKECLITGEGFIKPGLLQENSVVRMANVEFKNIIKKPIIEYISAFDVYFDPNLGIDESPFQFTRRFLSGGKIISQFSNLLSKDFDKGKAILEKAFEDIKQDDVSHSNKNNKKRSTESRFSNYNYNYIKKMTHGNKTFNNKGNNKNISIASDISSIDENNYFLINKSKTYEVIEYNEDDRTTLFIDGVCVYDGKSIISTDLSRITSIKFSEIPGTGTSQGQVDQLAQLQRIMNSLLNGFLDNMAISMTHMFKVKGNVGGLTRDGNINIEQGKVIKLRGNEDIQALQLHTGDFAPLNAMQLFTSASERASGLNAMMLGGQAKVERVSSSVDVIYNQYKAKLLPVTDSVVTAMSKISKSWTMMFLEMYTTEELKSKDILIDISKGTVNDIHITDLLNEENISFSFNSLLNINNQSKRQILKDLIQVIPQMAKEAQTGIDFNEYIRALLDEDFDIDKLLKRLQENKTTDSQEEKNDIMSTNTPSSTDGNDNLNPLQVPSIESDTEDGQDLDAILNELQD